MLNVATIFSRFVATTTKYVSSASPSIQMVGGTSSTHPYINKQGVQILFNDGYRKEAKLFNLFTDQLDNGVVWIDKGLKSTYHHYDPDTGTGMWLWPSAAEKCSDFFTKSLKLWQNKKHALAMFFLGAAIHLVQDVCVPHHASCKVFNGHVEFEGWAEDRKDSYSIDSGGIYGISGKPEEWIAENARLAKNYYSLVENNSPDGYHRAIEILLPRAQRTTAGFLLHFYNQL